MKGTSGRSSGGGHGAHRRALLVAGAAVAFGVAAVSCSVGRRDGPPEECFTSEPDRCFVSHGAYVKLNGAVVRDSAAVHRAIARAMAYWSAVTGDLDGWVITFEDHEVECNGARASGCTSWRRRTLALQVLDASCPETAQLVHELGHVVLHDPGHRDSRWCPGAEQEATRALVRSSGASAGCAASRYYTGPARQEPGCSGPSGRPP
jgi:hypothetical protein